MTALVPCAHTVWPPWEYRGAAAAEGAAAPYAVQAEASVRQHRVPGRLATLVSI